MTRTCAYLRSGFGAYLRGIETSDAKVIPKIEVLFGAYLRGIETIDAYSRYLGPPRFGAYLRGIETSTGGVGCKSKNSVWSLPKRD